MNELSAPTTAIAPLYDSFMEVATRRMSIRELRPDPIAEDVIDKVLEAGRWAMSGGNGQPWEFMVVRDPAIKKALGEAYIGPLGDYMYWMEQMRLPELRHPAFQKPQGGAAEQTQTLPSWVNAPALIVILGDGRRQWATVQGAFTFGRHQSHLTDALSNAATLMHLACASLGLASQHVTIQLEEPFKRILDVPDLVMIHHIVPIGYSAIDRRSTPRRPLSDIVHYDRYDPAKYMENAEILEFLANLRGATLNAYHTKPKAE